MASSAVTKKERFYFYNGMVCLIKALEGKYSTVDLRNEAYVTGKIDQVDGFMNISMSDVTFCDAMGSEHSFESFFIRARNIRYVHIPDEVKVNGFLREETLSDLVFMVPLLHDGEAVIQVVGNKILDQELRFSYDNTIFKTAKESNSLFQAKSEDIEDEVLQLIKDVVETDLEFLICPIKSVVEDQTPLVVFIVNSKNKICYVDTVVKDCFKCCIGVILNTLRCEEEKRLKIQCQALLAVARNLFSHLGDVSDLLREIMAEARKLTKAERCSLFLLDPDHQELVAKVFDGQPTEQEVRIAKDTGIAGYVASSGQLLNIKDAYDHPLFYKGMDEVTGFRTRSILCFPIRDENGIVGVAQLCNKIGGRHFNKFDEEAALAFSIYCGISIMHSLIYKRVRDAQARSKVSNELLMYHMKIYEEDLRLIVSHENLVAPKDYDHFSFSPRDVTEDDSPRFVYKMFQDLGLLNTFRINSETLARFILYAKKGYRDTPYHNWMHAFSVTHFSYLLVKNLDLIKNGCLTNLEVLVFLVSCLCHDLDHRGTTNSFQTKFGTALACLYSSEGSIMERHHLSQALCILNTDGCNIFDGLSHKEYTKCLDLMKHNILATDLAEHLQILSEQREMVTRGYRPDVETDKSLLLSLLMSACDLSDQTKDWNVSRSIAELIYEEFFCQGDMEKSKGIVPPEMMDRNKARIPELQIQFLSDIVIPLFEVLCGLFPQVNCLLEAARKNRECWNKVVLFFSQQQTDNKSAISILKDPALIKVVFSDDMSK